MDNRTPHGKYQCPVPDLQEAQDMKTMSYRELIGTLLLVANGTTDIAYAVGTLALPVIQIRYTLEGSIEGVEVSGEHGELLYQVSKGCYAERRGRSYWIQKENLAQFERLSMFCECKLCRRCGYTT
jgi:hypothetical protein